MLCLLWSLLLCRLLLLQWSFLLLLQIVLLLLLFKIRNQNQTNMFICAYLFYHFFQIILFQNFFVISVVLSNCFKSIFKPIKWKRFMRRRIIINMRWKWWTSLWRPKLQKQNVEFFWLFSLCLLFSSLNFLNFCLDCLCNFSTKISL